jgi:hypothetical protein
MITKFNKYNKYYRAVEEDLSKTVEFEPLGYYEAIDKDGNPVMKYDTFWVSDVPEVAASKSIGGAVMGLYSMFMQHGKKPDTFYIYEIMEEPDVDISDWTYGDFEFLKEVRYRRTVIGKYKGKIKITDDIIKKFLAFYEVINLEPYDEPDEETSEIYQSTDYDKLISNMGKLLKESVKPIKVMTIKEFPYVMDFYNKNYPNKNISDIPVYVLSEEEWPDGKSRQTENDLKGGIRIHEDQVKIDSQIGWLIHEVGHVLELRGEKRPYLVSKKEFDGYPNEDNEQPPMWYQFHYLINKGLTEDQVISLEKRDYSNCKGGGTLWKDYKDKFFRRYYQEVKKKLNI